MDFITCYGYLQSWWKLCKTDPPYHPITVTQPLPWGLSLAHKHPGELSLLLPRENEDMTITRKLNSCAAVNSVGTQALAWLGQVHWHQMMSQLVHVTSVLQSLGVKASKPLSWACWATPKSNFAGSDSTHLSGQPHRGWMWTSPYLCTVIRGKILGRRQQHLSQRPSPFPRPLYWRCSNNPA